MLGYNFLKHIKEFQRYIRNYQYEVGDGNIYFPKASATVSGLYTHWVTGYESELREDHNLLGDEGLNHMLGVVLKSGSQVTTWYCMLQETNGTPTSTISAGTYQSAVGEITSGAEGYSQATRVLWVGDAVDTTNTEVVNLASPAAFTIVTATSLPVYGAALISTSTKGAEVAPLLSAGKFTAVRNLANGDTFNLKYKVDLDVV